MNKLFAAAAVLAALSGPAFAASGDVVTHLQTNVAYNGYSYPNALLFVTLSDGTFDSSGVMGGTIQCISNQDAGYPEALAMLHRSRDLGVNPSTGTPVSPVFFNTGTPSAVASGVSGVLHPTDCPANTYIWKIRQ